jgi:hypothetical protein
MSPAINNVVVVQEPIQIVQIKHLGVQGPPGTTPQFRHEARFITLAEQNAKKLILQQTASLAGMFLLQVSGSTARIRDIDYEYLPSENAISWLGKGLDTLLEENDLVEIIYIPV